MAEEAIAEQAAPVLHARGLADQHLLRFLVAQHDDDLEVVPRRAIEVDHDRASTQRTGDRAGDSLENGAELAAGPDRGGDVEQAAETVDGGISHLWVIGNRSPIVTSPDHSATLTAHSSS